MLRLDDAGRSWESAGRPLEAMMCPVCHSPLLRYENPDRWLCFTITVHDDALLSGHHREEMLRL